MYKCIQADIPNDLGMDAYTMSKFVQANERSLVAISSTCQQIRREFISLLPVDLYSYPLTKWKEQCWGKRSPGVLRFPNCRTLLGFLIFGDESVRSQVKNLEIGYEDKYAFDAFEKLPSGCPNLQHLIIHAGSSHYCDKMAIDSSGIWMLRNLRGLKMFKVRGNANPDCRKLLRKELCWKRPRDTTSPSYERTTMKLRHQHSILKETEERWNRMLNLRSAQRRDIITRRKRVFRNLLYYLLKNM